MNQRMKTINLVIIVFLQIISTAFSVEREFNQTDVTRVVQFSNSLIPPLFSYYSKGRENLVLAPFGVATNVAMMLECLQGRAADEIITLFRLQAKGSRQQLRRGFKAILDKFENELEGDFAGSYNKASLTSSRIMPSSFVNKLSKYYQANVTTVRGKNSDNITTDILELRSDTGLISHWKNYQNFATNTYLSYLPSAPFTLANGSIVYVPMIPQGGQYKIGYVERLKCLAVELMFETPTVSMLIMMPDNVDGSELLIDRLARDNFLDILNSLGQQETQILVPQLAVFTNALDLEPFFTKFGVKTVFNKTIETVNSTNINSFNNNTMNGSKSNGSKLPKSTLISLKQNAYFSMSFITINSVGSVGTKLGIHPNTNRKKREILSKIIFDKPFVFLILNKDTGLILLAGKITNPTQVPSNS
ncbi:leukocyte elastase inhibitor-like [Daktulosphaira vitifoliae]|uniref:leukocyte elastase inhibitor-like n=1 Tax=Daktulosphaira vitifoliae TaxID=58002 RepID=UPI0021AA3ABB|nr:leukocyte elastase inhibitor-like [Daktulosphaira vitifoliae]